jgi:hypothetical protein
VGFFLGGGGGGGGRIAIYSPSNQFAGDYFFAGGNGAGLGQTGTLYLSTSALMLTVSGTVTNASGHPVPGVVMQSNHGDIPSVLTGVNGEYSFIVPFGAAFTITPHLATNVFVPGQRSIPNLTTAITGQNHLMVPTIAPIVATAQSGTNLVLNWQGIPGVLYQVEGSTNLMTWTTLSMLDGTNGVMEFIRPTTGKPLEFLRLRAVN